MSLDTKNGETDTKKGRKGVPISVHTIAKRHLPADAMSWPQEKTFEELNNISHIRLDRENINEIDSFELLGPKVTNLYLQYNCIKIIENLESLRNLVFLTLASNEIKQIEGLTLLNKLGFLDLSDNHIASFDIDMLPQSLAILNLSGNPCTELPDYRGRLVQDLPKLRQLDNQSVTKTERIEAGYKVSDDDTSSEEDDDEEETGVTRAIQEVFSTSTGDMLWRSQSRMEKLHKDHLGRLSQLDQIRKDNNLPPTPRSLVSHRT